MKLDDAVIFEDVDGVVFDQSLTLPYGAGIWEKSACWLVGRIKYQATQGGLNIKSRVSIPSYRWWFHIFIFTPKIGEDEPILTHIFVFPMGWNHQL